MYKIIGTSAFSTLYNPHLSTQVFYNDEIGEYRPNMAPGSWTRLFCSAHR